MTPLWHNSPPKLLPRKSIGSHTSRTRPPTFIGSAGQSVAKRGSGAGRVSTSSKSRKARTFLVYRETEAASPSPAGWPSVFHLCRGLYSFIERTFADDGYAGERVATATLIAVEIVRQRVGH